MGKEKGTSDAWSVPASDMALAGQTFSHGLEQSSGQSSGSNSGKKLINWLRIKSKQDMLQKWEMKTIAWSVLESNVHISQFLDTKRVMRKEPQSGCSGGIELIMAINSNLITFGTNRKREAEGN